MKAGLARHAAAPTLAIIHPSTLDMPLMQPWIGAVRATESTAASSIVLECFIGCFRAAESTAAVC